MKILIYLFVLVSFLSCFEDQSRMVVDGKMEPPAPDESENNETIGGIDSNNDGVRDDIERWINRKFPGEENYNKRMAWKQKAKRIRDILINSTSKQKAVELIHIRNEASDCVFYIYVILKREDGGERQTISEELQARHVDTKSRLEKFLFADRSFGGEASVSTRYSKKQDKCEFKLRKQ